MKMQFPQMRTAEHVGDGHPDKFCDQVVDRILQAILERCPAVEVAMRVRTALECLAKDNLIVVSGEMSVPDELRGEVDISRIAKSTWEDIGYGDADDLTVVNHIQSQSADIAVGSGSGVDDGGAGDQGIMVGYATDETEEMMPKEWVLARDLCLRLKMLRSSGAMSWLLPDTKSQVTLDEEGMVAGYILAAQHEHPAVCGLSQDEMREAIFAEVVRPVLGDAVQKDLSKINGTGMFTIGGPTGDAGVVGRKIVVDAYGPHVPVGGGAYSGKDPTKVDRSAAYMARHIAKAIVRDGVSDAKEATVHIAYGIGQVQPEMVTAVTDSGDNVSDWVRDNFPDLSPRSIMSYLGLWSPKSWKYSDAASYGHYGRNVFPWEQPARVPNLINS